MMINKVYDDTFISENLCLCTYKIELYNQFIFEFRWWGGGGTYLNISDIFVSCMEAIK